MQAEINRICESLKAPALADASLDLQAFLTVLIPDTVDDIMTEIRARQTLAPEGKDYATELLTILRLITENTLKGEQLQCTGKIKVCHCMCLFVCGLLTHPSMSFLELARSHKHYADTFWAYTIQNKTAKIFVLDADLGSTVSDEKFEDLQTGLTGKSFICARENSPKNMTPKKILILDAFSQTNQFVNYNAVVWHAYCLWLFATGAPNAPICCYGVSTGDRVFLFLANYEGHVDTVIKKADRKTVISDLILKPLQLYREACKQCRSTTPSETVISRSHHTEYQKYVPLSYVHLLVRPSLPLYADVNYGDTLEQILAFAAGVTQADILSNLTYNFLDEDTSPIAHQKSSPAQISTAHTILADAHYDLMMQNKFVIPENATQQEILFDNFTNPNPQRSQHRDFIAAVCDVRYNWVFDPLKTLVWQPAAPPRSTSYHEIDVHRHVTHLQMSGATISDLLKRLSTGAYVEETSGSRRNGVIVFDVQEHGRSQSLFKGRRDPQDKCSDVCTKFGMGNNATTDDRVTNAMLAYFDPDTAWSLCDMAYKYVVCDASASQPVFFLQDSYALKVDDTRPPNASTCAYCPFCPVCFMSPPAALAAGDNTMYEHIVNRHDRSSYYIADLPEPAPQSLAVNTPGAGTPATAASSASSHHSASSASASSHSASSSEPDLDADRIGVVNARAGADADETARMDKIEELVQELSQNENLKPIAADNAQAALSEGNYAKLKSDYAALQKKLDEKEQSTEQIIQELRDELQDLKDKIKEYEAEKDKTKTLEQTLRDLQEKNQKETEDLAKQHEENMKKAIDNAIEEQKRSNENNEKLQKAIAALQQTLDEQEKAHTESNQTNDAEIRRLQAMIEALQNENKDLRARILELEARVAALQLEIENLKSTQITKAGEHSQELRKAQEQVRQLTEDLNEAEKEVNRTRADMESTTQNDSELIVKLGKDKTQLNRDLEKKKRHIRDLKACLQKLQDELQHAVDTKRTGLKSLQTTISDHVQTQIALGELAKFLDADPKQYKEFAKAVTFKTNAPLRSTTYSPEALFLILESMAGTWRLHLDNESMPDKTTTAYKEKQALVLRQFAYDINMWHSIRNRPKRTRYNSHYLQQFITNFGLENNEPLTQLTSSDDDSDGDADATAHEARSRATDITIRPADAAGADASSDNEDHVTGRLTYRSDMATPREPRKPPADQPAVTTLPLQTVPKKQRPDAADADDELHPSPDAGDTRPAALRRNPLTLQPVDLKKAEDEAAAAKTAQRQQRQQQRQQEREDRAAMHAAMQAARAAAPPAARAPEHDPASGAM